MELKEGLVLAICLMASMNIVPKIQAAPNNRNGRQTPTLPILPTLQTTILPTMLTLPPLPKLPTVAPATGPGLPALVPAAAEVVPKAVLAVGADKKDPPKKGDKDETDKEVLNNCWKYLIDAATNLCTFLINIKLPVVGDPGKYVYNLFGQATKPSNSSEEVNSDDDSDSDHSNWDGLELFNIFRARRSSELYYKDSLNVHNEQEFLDLLHEFYIISRKRFLEANPSVRLSADSDNLYQRTDELAEVAAFVLKMPKESLIQVLEGLSTKDTGYMILQALSDRQNILNGLEEFVNDKSFSSLSPTAISYFFQELLGSLNGISTGVSELASIVLENHTQTNMPQPNITNT